MQQDHWNSSHYLKYGSERTRAAVDLCTRIQLETPNRIADLGCGPGNSTHVLRTRWPDAEITGFDNSPDMLAAAREQFPEQNWSHCDIARWEPEHRYDLLYSNAAFQWVCGHTQLVQKLFAHVTENGALAFQIPSHRYARVRELIHEISRDPRWDDRMDAARKTLTMERPESYYDALSDESRSIDIWETEYFHIMESTTAIVDWISSTGLRPFVAVLDGGEKSSFVAELQQRVDKDYETRADGKVLYPFRRTFVIAYR